METLTKDARALSKTDMRDAFFEALHARARMDRDILLLSLDFGAPSLDSYRAHLPEQFINVGISEQNAISTAAGLAMTGKKVVVYSIASFVTARAFEQIKLDLCVMKLPVTIVGVGAGYAYNYDGPTHNALEDIALLRSLPNVCGICPSDPHMARAFVAQLPIAGGPTYIRLDRGKWPVLYDPAAYHLPEGLQVLRAGREVSLVASGTMVHRALAVADALGNRGIVAGVVDLYRFKPIFPQKLAAALGDADRVVTIEEHSAQGGVGGAVAEAMADAGLIKPLKRYAIADNLLYAYGERDKMHAQRGLSVNQITAGVSDWLASLLTGGPCLRDAQHLGAQPTA